jgi:pSer/pThr/pTyr-binding forkhead associated (FHA) protein
MGEALGYVEQPAPAPAEPEPRPPLGLIIVEGARSGQQILVPTEGVTIGRAALDPEDTSISRRHAVLSLRGDQLWLEDISLNGTRVNGERVFGESPIHIGDRVEIGGCLLSLSA